MKRAEMVERAARALAVSQYGEAGWDIEAARETWTAAAAAALDAILPQVTTVAELEALPKQSVVLDALGVAYEKSAGWWAVPGIQRRLRSAELEPAPFTVVWSPS